MLRVLFGITFLKHVMHHFGQWERAYFCNRVAPEESKSDILLPFLGVAFFPLYNKNRLHVT
jgi:hypothetical protein